MAVKVGNLAIILSANAAQLSAGFTAAEAKLNAFAQKVAGLGTKMGPAFRPLTDGLAGGISALAGKVGTPLTMVVGAAASLGQMAASEFMGSLTRGMAKEDEKLVAKIKFRYLVGDPIQADAMAARIKAVTGSGLLSTGDMMAASGRLVQSGMSGRQSVDLAKALGNIGFVTGGDVGGMADALARINTRGTITAKEIDRAGSAGMPMRDIAAEMGYTVDGLRRAAERGEVSLDSFNKAVVAAGQKFAVSVEQIAKGTTLGSQKRLDKAWEKADSAIASKFGYSKLGNAINDAKSFALETFADYKPIQSLLMPGLETVSSGFRSLGLGGKSEPAPAADDGAKAKAGAAFLRQKGLGALDLMQSAWEGFKSIGKDSREERETKALWSDLQSLDKKPIGAYGAFVDQVNKIDKADMLYGKAWKLPKGTTDRAKVEAFGQLESQMNSLFEPRLPAAMKKGSQAAESTISRAAMSFNGSRQEKIQAVLEAGLREQSRVEQNTKETADALKRLGVAGLGG